MIRALVQDDAAQLRALRLRSLLDAPDSFLSTHDAEAAEPEQVTRDRLRQLADAEDSGVLGAFEDGVLIGMVGIVRERHRKAAHRANLWGMFVAPEARGRGVGEALVATAIARLRRAGLEQVHLTVATTATAAKRLYERSGFVVIATLKSAMKDGDRYIDENLMVRQL